MDILKKVFPYSFGANDIKTMIIKIVVYVVVGYLLGFVVGLIPLGIITDIVGWVISIYGTVGWVLVILDYLKVLK